MLSDTSMKTLTCTSPGNFNYSTTEQPELSKDHAIVLKLMTRITKIIMTMKPILFQIILFGSLCYSASRAMAQQAKAYETVKYTASIKNYVFHLDYADGYIGASQIRLFSTRQKPKLFTPNSGTPEANGNFVLSLSSGTVRRQIILTGINEEAEAPNTITASYKAKGLKLSLLFYKNKP
jgi:hypothetical protein